MQQCVSFLQFCSQKHSKSAVRKKRVLLGKITWVYTPQEYCHYLPRLSVNNLYLSHVDLKNCYIQWEL